MDVRLLGNFLFSPHKLYLFYGELSDQENGACILNARIMIDMEGLDEKSYAQSVSLLRNALDQSRVV